MKQLPVGTRVWNNGRLLAARALTVAAVAAGGAVAQAHPGHALTDEGVSHVVTSPYHLSLLAGAGIALWLGARAVRQPLPRRLMQAGGLAMLAGTALLWGLRA
jgi:peptidoglycan/LPS O-acetylase OafA/YrhL